jgi:hypothetical protein
MLLSMEVSLAFYLEIILNRTNLIESCGCRADFLCDGAQEFVKLYYTIQKHNCRQLMDMAGYSWPNTNCAYKYNWIHLIYKVIDVVATRSVTVFYKNILKYFSLPVYEKITIDENICFHISSWLSALEHDFTHEDTQMLLLCCYIIDRCSLAQVQHATDDFKYECSRICNIVGKFHK